MKPCNCCGIAKALEEFVRRKTAKDGRDGTCKACRREIDAQYRKDHPERVAATLKKYRKAHPEKQREHAKRYRKRHPEKRRLLDARYRERNPGSSTPHQRAWREKNRERAKESWRISTAKRRALKAGGLAVVLSVHVTEALRDAFSGKCAWCGRDNPDHLDHIQPLSRGGAHAIGNLVPACARCNLKKHNKDPRHWAEMCGADLDLIRAKARIDIKSAI